MLAWDTETDLIRPAVAAPELACVSFSDGERSEVVHVDDARPYVEWLLQQETATANAPFDLAVVWSAFPDLRDLVWDAVLSGRVHDVLTRQKLIDIGEGKYRFIFKYVQGQKRKLLYSLSDLHARYRGFFMEKDEHRLTYGKLRHLPLKEWPEGALQYAKYDAYTTANLYKAQERRQAGMKRAPQEYLHNEIPQVQAHWALHLMAAYGVRTDEAQVYKVIERIDSEQPQLKDYLIKVGLVDRNGTRKDKRARALMFEVVGEAGELTDTGYEKVKAGLMTKAEALRAGYIKVDEEWCINSGDERLIKYDEYQQNQLNRSKISHFLTGSLPLTTRYEILLETGRTSSSEDRLVFNSAAVQNLPQKEGIREAIIAREGHSFLACDFGQAELVSLAEITYRWFEHGRSPSDPWYCRSEMRRTLNEGRDIHLDFAATLLGISYDEALRRHKEKDPEVKKYRQWAKPVNFGLPGGLSVDSLVSYARKVYGIKLTRKEAKWLYQQWLKKFPEMRLYFKYIRQSFNKRTVEDVIDDNEFEQDKKFRFVDVVQEVSGRIRGGCTYTVACNTRFQGLTADAAKAALVEVSRRCYTVETSALYGCRPILFVHDEIIVECPDEKITEAAEELEEVMVEVYSRFTPNTRITAGAHAMKRWSKAAEAVRDENGKLIPWINEKLEQEIEAHARKLRSISPPPMKATA
jgi:hypothetical protein